MQRLTSHDDELLLARNPTGRIQNMVNLPFLH